MTGPLAGVRVLDLSRLLPGGYCTLLLADLGADIIKVEEPASGDGLRTLPPLVDGQGAVHRALNRGKRSVTVNLKDPRGAALLLRLAASADALIESFRPGVLDRLGVGYDRLAEANPGLVHAALTGYGQDGPYRDRAGHDINYVGTAGILDGTGSPDGPPTLPAVQIADLSGGMAAAVGLLACLPEAARTGRGRFVDVSLMDAAVSWLSVLLPAHLATGQVPRRGAEYLTGGLACYRVYPTSDGRFLTVGALEPKFWEPLCRALGVPELVSDQFGPAQRQAEMASRLGAVLATRTRDQWMAELSGLEACVGPVNDLAEALADPQVVSREMIAEMDGLPVGPASPLKVRGAASAVTPAPGLGAHTDQVLTEAGLSAAEVAGLRAEGVI